MAQWQVRQIDKENINNGNEFENGDGVNASDINAVVENSLYTQEKLLELYDMVDEALESIAEMLESDY